MSLMAFLSGIAPSLATSAFDATLGALGNSQQNKYNIELAKYQNDYNTKMWHMQNEYNSPKATIDRLVEAGVNPRAYNNIGQFANASQPQPSAEMKKVSELSAYQSLTRQALENDMLRANINLANQRINEVSANTKLKKALTTVQNNIAYKQANVDFSRDMLELIIYAAQYGLEYNQNDINYFNGEISRPAQESPSIQKIIAGFNTRYDADINNAVFGASLRKWESLTKEERYRVLKAYGIDTEGDSIMGAIRAGLRIVEKW